MVEFLHAVSFPTEIDVLSLFPAAFPLFGSIACALANAS